MSGDSININGVTFTAEELAYVVRLRLMKHTIHADLDTPDGCDQAAWSLVELLSDFDYWPQMDADKAREQGARILRDGRLHQLAQMQGVKPITDPSVLQAEEPMTDEEWQAWCEALDIEP